MSSISTSRLLATGIALVLFGIGAVCPANAQFLQTVFDFQTIQPHPHVHALGNATVAARGYPGAIGVNPATIGTEGAARIGSNVSLSQAPFYSSPWSISGVAPGVWITAPSGTVKMGPWAAGVQVKHFSLGSTEIRSGQGDVLRTIDSYQQSIKLATAYDATSRITVGGGVTLIRSHLGSTQPSSDAKVHPTVDLGVHYQTHVEHGFVSLRPAFGVSLTDFGSNVSVNENKPGDSPLPTTIRGGGALQIVSQPTQFGRPEWRIGLYVALSNQLISGEYREKNGQEYFDADGPFTGLIEGWGRAKGIVGASGELETVGPWERIAKHAGMEMRVLDVFSFRLGRFHESDDLGGQQYTALGVGLDAYYVSFDVSWTLRDEEVYQDLSYGRFTVRIPLSDSPRNFWPELLGRLD